MSTEKFADVFDNVILLPPPGRSINWPSEEGAKAGKILADMIACPAHEMCEDCVFRHGSFPNQCADTLDAAMLCIIDPKTEGVFLCAHREDESQPICGGYAHAMKKMKGLL